jgi:hypothetical protein
MSHEGDTLSISQLWVIYFYHNNAVTTTTTTTTTKSNLTIHDASNCQARALRSDNF